MPLNLSHALYPNVIRSLKGHDYLPEMMDQIGTDHLAGQANHTIDTNEEQALVTPQQGIATDGAHWYAISSGTIKKHDFLTGALVATNPTPLVGLPAGVDHLGDGFEDGGLLYVPAVNWDGATQTSTDQTIAVYNTSDLSLNTQYDISSSTAFNAAGFCKSKTGTILGVSFETSSTSEPEQHDIYEFNLSTGAYIATLTLDFDSKGTQGITYDSDLDLYALTSFDLDAGENYVYFTNSAGELVSIGDLSFVGATGVDEIEGICYHASRYYFHLSSEPLRSFTPNGLFLNDTRGVSEQFLTQAQIPDTGSLIFRLTPYSFFNYNSIFDSKDTANDWETWVYATGEIAWRVSSAGRTGYTLPSPRQQYIVMMAWNKDGSNVDLTLGVDGVFRDTATTAWAGKPAQGLWLAGANASNDEGINLYSDIVLLDKVLSASEFTDLSNDFDDIYDSGVSQIVGVASEIGTLLPVVPAESKNVSISVEAGTLQSVSASESKTVGLVVEVGSLQALIDASTILGTITELGTFQPLTASESLLVSAANETGSLQTLSAAEYLSVGTAIESALLQAITAGEAVTVGAAAESGSVQQLLGFIASLGTITEAGTLQPITARESAALGPVAELGTVIPYNATVIQTPDGRVFAVMADNRSFAVARDDRSMSIH